MGDLTGDCSFWITCRRAALLIAHALADRGMPWLQVLLTGKAEKPTDPPIEQDCKSA